MSSSESVANLEFLIYDFFNKYLLYLITFSTDKLINKCFGPIRNLFSFSTAYAEKKIVDRIGEANW